MEKFARAVALLSFIGFLTGCGRDGKNFSSDTTKWQLRPLTSGHNIFLRSAEIVKGHQKKISKSDRDYREVVIEKVFESGQRNHRHFPEGQRVVAVNGIKLILAKEEEGVYQDFHNAEDIKRFVINAEEVEIHDKMNLPGSELVINARVLRVFGGGAFDITPLYKKDRPEKEGERGLHGESSGNIVLNIEELELSLEEDRPVFLAKGGRGQDGGRGRIGKDGASMPTLNGKGVVYHKEETCVRPPRFPMGEMGNFLDIGPPVCLNAKISGRESWPENGEDARPGGVPGNPGNGGVLLSNIPIEGLWVDVSGGVAGKAAPDYRGGAAGTPVHASHRHNFHLLERHTSKRGRDARSPRAEIPLGAAGQLEVRRQEKGSWIELDSMRMFLKYVEDSYLMGHFEEAQKVCQRALGLLQNLAARQGDGMPANRWQLMVLQFKIEKQKLNSHLDYFGHRAGQLPSFHSLPSFRKNFVEDVESALEWLYWARRMPSLEPSTPEAQEALNGIQERLSRDIEGQWKVFQETFGGAEVLKKMRQKSELLEREAKTFLASLRRGKGEDTPKRREAIEKTDALLQSVPIPTPFYGELLSSEWFAEEGGANPLGVGRFSVIQEFAALRPSVKGLLEMSVLGVVEIDRQYRHWEGQKVSLEFLKENWKKMKGFCRH